MSYIGRAPTDTGEFRLIDEISSSFDGSTQSFDLKVGTLAITPTKENIIIGLKPKRGCQYGGRNTIIRTKRIY